MVNSMAEYQGHRSWNAWNVALWISNEEPLYRLAMESLKKACKGDCTLESLTIEAIANRATSYFLRWAVCLGDRTPDGAVYNRTCVREALIGLME